MVSFGGRDVAGKGPAFPNVANGKLAWTDIADPTPEQTAMLGRDYGFDQLDLQDCLSGKVTKLEDRGDYMFLLLHFPEVDAQGLVGSNRVSMFLGKDYLVTLRPSKLKSVGQLFQSCREDEKERDSLMKSSTYVAYQIINSQLDSIFSILDVQQGQLDRIEAVVFDEKKPQARPINHARRRIAALGKILFSLRANLPDLSKGQKFSPANLSAYFSDLNHKITLASRTVDEMKELLEIYKDTDYMTTTNKTNSVLVLLTIFFTLTIPATLITSFYGMNVPLPGAFTTGPFTFAGEYSTLLVVLIIMVVPAAIMIYYFRRGGWF